MNIFLAALAALCTYPWTLSLGVFLIYTHPNMIGINEKYTWSPKYQTGRSENVHIVPAQSTLITENPTWLLFHEWSSSLPACWYKYSPVLTAADFITWLLLLCWLHDRRSCAVRITSQFFTSPLHNMCWRHNWFTEFTWCSQLKSCALCMNLLHVTWLKWHWILTIMNTVGHQILKSECSVQMKSALEKTNI